MADIAPAGPFVRHVLRGPGSFPIDVPRQPMRSVEADGVAALWLGPDEWLLLRSGEGALDSDSDGSYALVDVSDRQVALSLTGDDAALLLNGAVPLDLSLAAFPVGMCTRTIFEKAEIVLWRRAATDWHIEVARSFAPYVRTLLAAVARADGVPLSD